MRYLIFLLASLLMMPVYGEIFVVVSHESAIHQMDESEVADVYLGRKRSFGRVDITQVFDRSDEVRARFFLAKWPICAPVRLTRIGLSLNSQDGCERLM